MCVYWGETPIKNGVYFVGAHSIGGVLSEAARPKGGAVKLRPVRNCKPFMPDDTQLKNNTELIS